MHDIWAFTSLMIGPILILWVGTMIRDYLDYRELKKRLENGEY